MTVINSTNYPILDSNIISSYAMKVTNSIGKSFLDFEAGVWCLPLGHNPIELNNVYKHQTNELTHNGYLYTSPILEEAATKILNITNIDNGDVVFLSSGSEAVEYAIQAAKKIKPNKKGCRLKGYYLSAYGNASSINQDWIEIDDSIDDIDFTQIGYFLFEPGNYSGIVKLPCKELINGIIEKIKANNGIIIIDEVTTGLGRTGKWFGYMHYDLIPDIITIGKGLGNGYPVSSVVFNTGVYTLAYNQGFRYAQSHQNDPLGAKISLKVIDLIKEKNLIPHTCEIGKYFINQLETLAKKYSFIKNIRGVGLMNAFDFSDDFEITKIPFIQRRLYDEGIFVQVKDTIKLIRFYPPLIINKEQIDYLISKLDSIFKYI